MKITNPSAELLWITPVSKAAHPQIRQLMTMAYDRLCAVCPVVFEDFQKEGL